MHLTETFRSSTAPIRRTARFLRQRVSVLILAALTAASCPLSARGDVIALEFTGGFPFIREPAATLGWQFTTSGSIDVTALGFWDTTNAINGSGTGSGLVNSHDVGI